MAGACDLKAMARIRASFEEALKKQLQDALEELQITKEDIVLRSKKFDSTAAEVGSLPDWVGKTWDETFPKVRGIEVLDKIGLDPETVWATEEGRNLLLSLKGKKSAGEIREALANWLIARGEISAAAVLQAPWLVFSTRWFGYQKPTQRRVVASGRADPAEHLPEDMKEILERVKENKDLWPRFFEALANQYEIQAELAEKAVEFRKELEDIALGEKLVKDRSQLDVMMLDELLVTIVTKGSPEAGKAVVRLFRDSGLPVVSENPQELFFAYLEKKANEDIEQRIQELPTVLPRFLHQIWDAIGVPIRRFTREYSLARPGYVLMQLLQDSLIKPFLSGYGKVIPQILLEYRSYYKTWGLSLELGVSPRTLRRSGMVAHTGLDEELRRYGIRDLPEEITADLERNLGFLEIEVIDPTRSSLFRLPVIGKELLGEGLLGKVPIVGSVLRSRVSPFRLLAQFSSWVSVMARAQESATRKAIYATAFFGRLWNEEWESFSLQVRELAQRWKSDLTPEALLERMKEDGLFSPDHVSSIVFQMTLNRGLAQQVGNLWADAILRAERYGVEEAQRINYDYLRRTVADDILSWIFKFHFWAVRNLPFYLEQFLRHKVLFVNWIKAQADIYEDRMEGRRGPYLGQALRLLEKRLFGQSLVFYMDLFDLISVTSQIRQWDEISDSRNFYELFRNAAGSLTLSLNWDVAMIAWLLGYDLRLDPPAPSPVLGAIPRALGLSGAWPLSAPAFVLQEALSGRLPGTRYRYGETLTGSKSLDRAIWQEIVIMSIERTGRPNHFDYLAALADPSNPIFQEARDRVLSRARLEQGISFISPQRIEVESGAEEDLRALQAELGWESLPPWTRSELIQQGHPAAWTVFVPSDLREAQIRTGQALVAKIRTGRSPLTVEEVRERYPWYARYEEWKARRGEGQSRSVSAFLRETR